MLLHRTTGTAEPVIFRQLSARDMIKYTKRHSWNFDWQLPFKNGDDVFGLFLRKNATLQGLVALFPSVDHGAIVLDLVESAPHNVGKFGHFDFVGENLFAFTGILSFQKKFEGYLFLTAKSGLVEYYLHIGAKQIRGRDFVFTTSSVQKLIDRHIGGDDIVQCN